MDKWKNLARKNSHRNVFNICQSSSQQIKTHINTYLVSSTHRELSGEVDNSIDFSVAEELRNELGEQLAVK